MSGENLCQVCEIETKNLACAAQTGYQQLKRRQLILHFFFFTANTEKLNCLKLENRIWNQFPPMHLQEMFLVRVVNLLAARMISVNPPDRQNLWLWQYENADTCSTLLEMIHSGGGWKMDSHRLKVRITALGFPPYCFSSSVQFRLAKRYTEESCACSVKMVCMLAWVVCILSNNIKKHNFWHIVHMRQETAIDALWCMQCSFSWRSAYWDLWTVYMGSPHQYIIHILELKARWHKTNRRLFWTIVLIYCNSDEWDTFDSWFWLMYFHK